MADRRWHERGAPPEGLPQSEALEPDWWHWLRDQDDPAVVAYLEAENQYAEQALAPLEPLRERLFTEMRDRLPPVRESCPFLAGGWEYLTRFAADDDYPVHLRRRAAGHGSNDSGPSAGADLVSLGASVVLNENELAEGHDYFSIGDADISADGRLVAYVVDTEGDERHHLVVREIESGREVCRWPRAASAAGEDTPSDHAADPTSGDWGLAASVAWGPDSSCVYVVRLDSKVRPFEVLRIALDGEAGRRPSQPQGEPQIVSPTSLRVVPTATTVFTELDERFFVAVSRSRDYRLVEIESASLDTTEVLVLAADGEPALVLPRQPGVEYQTELQGERLLVVTNSGASDFRLITAPLADVLNGRGSETAWEELLGAREGVRLEGVDGFADFAVLYERAGGQPRARFVDCRGPDAADSSQADAAEADWAGAPALPAPAGPHEVGRAENAEFDASTYRYVVTSMAQPPQTFELRTKAEPEAAALDPPTTRDPSSQPHPTAASLIHTVEVAGGFRAETYRTDRLWAPATDGEPIPVTAFWRPNAVRWPAPCVLYGYGAYDICLPATFSSAAVSLADRGCLVALAHVRGGGELGRRWYEAGRRQDKPTGFDDFAACARYLVTEGWAAAGRLVARGGSAGGLLVVAAAQRAPELFAAVVAQEPFVDVLNTMSDPSLPLTVTEYDEWGNPNDPEAFATIRSYAPYEQVGTAASRSAHMLVTGSLNDSRVGYWEPAKLVAALRWEHQQSRQPSYNNSTISRAEPNVVLLQTDMGSGHSGPSAKLASLHEEAGVLAFTLWALGLAANE